MRILLFIILLFSISCSVDNKQEKQKSNLEITNPFENTVFNIGPEIDSTEFKVFGFCDCCTSTLIFKDDNRYIYNSFCQGSEYITSGKYKLDEDFLHLISDTICMMYEYNWENEVDTSAVDFILKSKTIERQKFQFQINKFKNNILLIGSSGKSIEYGLENTYTTIEKELKLLFNKGILKHHND
jgi:hypothetical protein